MTILFKSHFQPKLCFWRCRKCLVNKLITFRIIQTNRNWSDSLIQARDIWKKEGKKNMKRTHKISKLIARIFYWPFQTILLIYILRLGTFEIRTIFFLRIRILVIIWTMFFLKLLVLATLAVDYYVFIHIMRGGVCDGKVESFPTLGKFYCNPQVAV